MGSSKFLSTLKKAATTASDILTTKGDILSRSSSALGRLGIGTNNQVLTADSAQALGLKWATPSGVSLSDNNTWTGINTFNLAASSPDFTGLPHETVLLTTNGDLVYTQSQMSVDTYAGAGTDDCTGVTNAPDGSVLYLKSIIGTRDVTMKDSSGGAGDIMRLAGDFTFTTPEDSMMLIQQGNGELQELSRSDNG